MADPFIAEIRIFPFNFAARGWAWCDGQLMPLSQNAALFSLLGTTYGGDGRTNFALPDLMGRAAMHPGQGPGLSPHDLGESAGTEIVTLQQHEIPEHGHTMMTNPTLANSRDPNGGVLARTAQGMHYAPPSASVTPMAPEALAPVGGSAPHNNMQPYLTMYFNIALQGVFPSRT